MNSKLSSAQVREAETCFTSGPIALLQHSPQSFLSTSNPTSTAETLAEWGRWQDVKRCFGIKRGTLYNLVAEGTVKSVSLRRKGTKYGCRLFFLPGIRDYLKSLMAEQNH